MQYDFLKHFPRRMKNVGLYAVLVQNSLQKATWKKYDFQKMDEQFNLIFTVLLYIMEQSLKEEPCTIDDIGAFLDTVNAQYFRKKMTYEDCRNLGDFIVNVILSNEGKGMNFDGFHFEQNVYKTMTISYIANRVVYSDQDVKRTSYYLTDDGYNLLLSTLEIENNMKLTIHEMIFQMHLEKQSYDKAADEIKNVFHLLRIQLQKIEEAMRKIRRNALNYSVQDYQEILNENLETISETKEKFRNYQELVKSRVQELEEANINLRKLTDKEQEKLCHLKVIEQYLSRAMEEHQKILNSHFDLKFLYTKELEALSQMSLIQRFPLRSSLYDKILERPDALERLEYFLRPLFYQEAEKSYNLKKAFQLQRPLQKVQEAEPEERLDFDSGAWEQEQQQMRRQKLSRYQKSLSFLLERVAEAGELSLMELSEQVKGTDRQQELIPNVEIFKEIMVELIRNKEIDIAVLGKEKSEYIQEPSKDFQLNVTLLQIVEESPRFQGILGIEAFRLQDGKAVEFTDVHDEFGNQKTIRCSNVLIRVREDDKAQKFTDF